MNATWKNYEVHHSWESDCRRGISVTRLCIVVPGCLWSLKNCNTTVQRPLAMYKWDSFLLGGRTQLVKQEVVKVCAKHIMEWHDMQHTLKILCSHPDTLACCPLTGRYAKDTERSGRKAAFFPCLMFHAISVLVSVTEAKKRIRYMKPRLDASLSIVLSPCICKEEEKSCLTLSTVVSRLDSQIKVGNT